MDEIDHIIPASQKYVMRWNWQNAIDQLGDAAIPKITQYKGLIIMDALAPCTHGFWKCGH